MFSAFSRHKFRLYVVSAFAFFLLGTVAIPGLHTASADPIIRISPPQPYYASDAELEIGVNVVLGTGNSIDMIRITLDSGTVNEKFYEFDINGKVRRADAGLAGAYCDPRFNSDGYSIGLSGVDCCVVLDKSVLAAGTHKIRSELVSEIGVFSDDSQFTYTIAAE